MLTCYRTAARNLTFAVIWAVFSVSNMYAAERPLGSLENGMNDLIYSLSRSVVTIENYRSVPSSAFGGNETIENLVSSGVICDTFGHILVSAAMVTEHDRLIVNFENHRYPANLIAVDYLNDIALILPAQKIGAPAVASPKRVCAGQMVVAMGHAYGLRATPTIGFCAGLRPDGNLQFSASITPTAVGGGVFDLQGNLLGIIVGQMGRSTDVTIAVPAHQLSGSVGHMLTHGDRQAGYIGVSTADIEITPGIELPTSVTAVSGPQRTIHGTIDRGVIVTYVSPGSPAERAGLVRGDLIVGFYGQRITTAADLARMVKLARPGSFVEVNYIRSNRVLDAKILIGKKSAGAPMADIDQYPSEPSPDSLAKVLQYLKQETSRLEQRLKRAR
ncbi:MAG: S1C family serine protease [candidate division Zixibacteria bacterium]|nr:S1C family serine protease [candidate division Zixibacteria bacterium]